MASLYQRERSPYWWIKYRAITGKICYESTGYRVGIASETAKARQLRARKTQEEADTGRVSDKEFFDRWVIGYLDMRYGNRITTLTKYRQCWNAISTFLESIGIRRPRQLKRDHVMQFIKWRQTPPKDSGVRPVCLNSALLDARIGRLVMFEAIARDFATSSRGDVATITGLQGELMRAKIEARADILREGNEQMKVNAA